MKKLLITSLSILCLQSLTVNAQETETEYQHLSMEQNKALAAEAKQHIMALGGALKATLKQGIKADGHAASVKLCHLQAPLITKASSIEGGLTEWTVSRTSLKLRSPANTPNDWVKSIMNDFEKRKASGETAKNIAHTEVRDGRFFLVKAIPTQAGCLACHGANIASDVKAKLTELYPNDKATGFEVGDIRGVFVASKKL